MAPTIGKMRGEFSGVLWRKSDMTVVVDDELIRRAIDTIRRAAEESLASAEALREIAGVLEAALVDAESYGELTEAESAEVVAAGLEALEDAKHGRILTLEEADARFEADFAAARKRVRELRASNATASASADAVLNA